MGRVNPGFKLCVPLAQVQDLLIQQHSDIGHFGADKTFSHMFKLFYWPRMRRYVRIVSASDSWLKTNIFASSQPFIFPAVVDELNLLD